MRRSVVWRLCLLGLLAGFVVGQSVDEEERVHVGGEGSGALIDSDDEDLADASGLPPEQNYATSMSPRFSTKQTDEGLGQVSATTAKMPTTTIIRSDKVTRRTKTLRSQISTSPPRPPKTTTQRITTQRADESTPATFSMMIVVILVFILIVVLLLTIVIVVICRRRSSTKQGYSPGVQR